MAYKYLKPEGLQKKAFHPSALLAAPIGAASGVMHSERGLLMPAAAGATGGTLGMVPGVLAGTLLSRGRMGGARASQALAAAGGTAGALAGGAYGGRFTDYLIGIVPGRKDKASSRVAAWLRDRDERFSAMLGFGAAE